MTNAVKLFFPIGEHHADLVVGTKGVQKIFFDKENPLRLVVLTEDNIVTYTGFVVIEQKDYKEK